MQSKNLCEDVIFFMGVCVQAFELVSFVVALGAEKEVVAVLAHVAILLDLSFATETFVFLFLAYLGLEDGLELVLGFVAAEETVEGTCWTFEIAFLT